MSQSHTPTVHGRWAHQEPEPAPPQPLPQALPPLPQPLPPLPHEEQPVPVVEQPTTELRTTTLAINISLRMEGLLPYLTSLVTGADSAIGANRGVDITSIVCATGRP